MTNTASAPKKKRRLSMHQKQSLAGWAFLMPATLLIFIMSFYPMFSALLTSFKRGKPTALVWSEPLWRNYQFMLKDKVFIQSVTNTLTYLIIQVPIMLILAVIFASLLNNRDLKFRGLFRTCIFLPCATGLVAYSMIFRTLFTYDGMVNNILLKFGLISEAINWLNDPVYAKAVIIIGLVWRWTGYNMVFTSPPCRALITRFTRRRASTARIRFSSSYASPFRCCARLFWLRRSCPPTARSSSLTNPST